MRKRQRKKNEKKYLPVIADEFPLVTMTEDEQEEARKGYLAFRKKYAFRKRYKDLKAKPLVYYYPMGNRMKKIVSEMSQNRSNLNK